MTLRRCSIHAPRASSSTSALFSDVWAAKSKVSKLLVCENLAMRIPAAAALRTAEFATIRLHLIKLAARVIETATRIRIAFGSACPDAAL